MTRAKISQYSATANDNTDVNGVNIAEGCPPSSMNNMGREIMAALKRFQVGSDGDGVTVGGSLVVSGSTSVNTFNVDVISEKTSAAGVTVDGVLLKDGGLNTSGQVVFNDAGADVDFRVEGDGNANLIVADAGVDKVGIGTNTFNTNGGVLQVSNGISFPATQSACSDANTLDDYEEGTFTPTASNFTVSGTSTLTGAYTKIGRLVFVSVKFENTGTIAHSTSALITLPFAPVTGAVPSGFIAMYVNNNGETFTSGKNGTQCVIDTEGSARFLVGNLTTTSAGQILYFSGFYRVS